MARRLLQLLFGLTTILCLTYGDISHYFAATEYGNYYQPQVTQHGQHTYQAPSVDSYYGRPNSVTPSSSVTQAPLPEIIENRNAPPIKNFIPLKSQYIPPEEQPNYDGPKPPQQSDDFAYYYPRPSSSMAPIVPSTTTTTERAHPIVVQDPGELTESDENDKFLGQSGQGYNYNAPTQSTTIAPAYLPPDATSVELTENLNTLRLRVKEMRCLKHTGGYLRGVFKLNNFIGAAPTVDTDTNDKRCELNLSRNYVVINIKAEDFQHCGVHDCDNDLCLRLRFPVIRGMRTASDAILTLHCKTQDRVAVKMHALKMGVTKEVQARSMSAHAHGGMQYPFRTHIELLRRGNNGFTRKIDTHGIVQLGEELLLRAHVIAGDGWNHTKLTDVNLQRISDSGEVLNNAQLLNSRGCLNPALKSVCAHAPSFDPPLGHKLNFKAFMFEGMRSGEGLLLSLRLTACLEQQDCQLMPQDCSVGFSHRRRRSILNENSTAISEISQFTFSVVKPKSEIDMEDVDPKGDPHITVGELLLTVIGFLIVVIIVSVAIYLKCKIARRRNLI